MSNKLTLLDLFNTENDYKIHLFLDYNSLFSLSFTSKLLKSLIDKKYYYLYAKNIYPDLNNPYIKALVLKIWMRQIKEKRLSHEDDLMNESKFNKIDFSYSNELNYEKLSKNGNFPSFISNSFGYNRKRSSLNSENKSNITSFNTENFSNVTQLNKVTSNENGKDNINNTVNHKEIHNKKKDSSILITPSNLSSPNHEHKKSCSTVVREIREKQVKNDKLEETFSAIGRDLDRTFHIGRFNSNEGKSDLKEILESIAVSNPDIGYCQGMNFVAGALLEFSESKEKSIEIFQFMLDYLDVYYLYIEQMPDYSIRMYQIVSFIKTHHSDLYFYFKSNDLPFDMILQKWIMTLFANTLLFDKLFIVFHFFLLEGWEAIIKYSFILISLAKDKLKTYDLEQISKFSVDKIWIDKIKTKDFYRLYIEYEDLYKLNNPINNETLLDLRDMFYIDLIEKKIQMKNWKEDQIKALEKFKHTNGIVQSAIKKEINNYKVKIEDIAKEYKKMLVKYQNELLILNKNKMKLISLFDEKDGLEIVLNEFSKGSCFEVKDNTKDNINEDINEDSIKEVSTINNSYRKHLDIQNKNEKERLSQKPTPEKQSSSSSYSYITGLSNYLYGYIGYFNQTKQITEKEDKEKLEKEEKERLKRRYEVIINDISSMNSFLNEYFIYVDSIKEKVEKIEKKKKDMDRLFRNYLYVCNIKEKSLLKELCEELKKSIIYKQKYEFYLFFIIYLYV